MNTSTSKTRDRRGGFTLTEIMIVVAIIGMLAGIAIPNFLRARSTSQTNACISNLSEIFSAEQQWALEYRQSPDAAVAYPDIQPYLRYAVICPAGGVSATFASSYTLTTVTNVPTCQIAPATHVLASDTSS